MATKQLDTHNASDAPAKSGKKRLLMVLVLVIAVIGAGYWSLLRETPEKAPVPGEVMALEPIQVNLAAGHYLKVGVALQLTDAVADEPDGSKALDRLIALFSGRPLSQLNRAERRGELKKELQKELVEEYEGDVMAVYFTNFVTQ